jgi:hypothetical protein
MEFLNDLANGLQHSPLAWILALCLVVIGYLYRGREQDQKDKLEKLMAKEAEHRATLEKVIPIAEKLGDSVEALQRITDNLLREEK